MKTARFRTWLLGDSEKLRAVKAELKGKNLACFCGPQRTLPRRCAVGDCKPMIVVRVELWSAITGSKTELARMEICNDGTGTTARRNYIARTLRGRSTRQLDRAEVQRYAELKDWPGLCE